MNASTAVPILLTVAGAWCELVAIGLVIEKRKSGVLIALKKWINAHRRKDATVLAASAELRLKSKFRARVKVHYTEWDDLDVAARVEQLYNRIGNLEVADEAVLDRLDALEDDAERNARAIDHARREAENKLGDRFTLSEQEARRAAIWLVSGVLLGALANVVGAAAG